MNLIVPVLALSVASGVWLGSHLPLPPTVSLGVALGTVLLGAATRKSRMFGIVFLLVGLSLGLAVVRVTLGRPTPKCHVSRIADGRTERMVLDVVAAPDATQTGWRVLTRARRTRSAFLCGGLELHLPQKQAPDLRDGDRLLLRGRIRPATGSRNPGTGSSRLRLVTHDIGARVYSPHSMVLLHPARRSPLQRIRDEARALIRQATPSGGSGRQIVRALVLGERGRVDPTVRSSFALAGISHLLAVSGLHLTLLCGGVLLFVRRGLLMVSPLAQRIDVRQLAAPMALVAAVLYTLLTGCAPSTTRACIMASACLLGLCSSRPPDLVRPLGLALFVLLVIDPLNLWRPGFQLSFMAVAGIGIVAARSGLRQGRLRTLVRATTAATLMTLPVVAYHFNLVSLAGLVTNLVAIPITTFVLLPLALVGTATGLVCPELGIPLLTAAGWVAERLVDLAAIVASSDLVVFRWSPDPLLALAGSVAAAGLLLAPAAGRVRRVLLVAALLLAAGSVLGWLGREHVSPRMTATFLDVGQGDSTFVRLPGGRTLLVDGGGTHMEGGWDPGAARVVPFLASEGVRRLDLVVATHPHPDHIKGLLAVLDNVEVGELWVCWHPDLQLNRYLRRLLERARLRRVPVHRPRRLRLGQATVRPVWPTQGNGAGCADPASSANDNSVVLRLEYGAAAMILAGDIEELAEAQLAISGAVRAQVLKVPHHGSDTSSTWPFLRAVAPRVAVISSGAGNSFRFPRPEVLARYRQLKIRVVRTDQVGAVRVELFPDGEVRWHRLVRF